MNFTPEDLTAMPWTRMSEVCFIHRSGASIERRSYPAVPGWYLIPDQRGPALHRFLPNPQGCDDAFVAFSARYAV